MTTSKPKFKDNKKDLREKECRHCGKITMIHKYDLYCSDTCRSSAKKKAVGVLGAY